MNTKSRFSLVMALMTSAFLGVTASFGGAGGCGGGAGSGVDGQFEDLEITSTETSGALSVGGTVDVNDDGNLVMRLNAIPNPDDPESPFAEDDLDFTENFTETEAALIIDGVKHQVDFSCTVSSVGEGGAVPTDFVFVVDTTASMNEEIDSVKNSIIEFADAVSDVLDVRFALVTFGDKVNTDDDLGCKRRLLNFSGSTSAESATALQTFIETADNGVVGCDGAGITENAFGAMDCARSGGACNLTFRDGASRVFILITDVETHVKEGAVTQEANGDTVDPLPPTYEELVASLGGDAVFTISNDAGDDPDTTEDGQTNPARLAINGGIDIALGSGTFNLGDIPLTAFVTGGYQIVCTPPDICGGRTTVNGTLECVATDSTGRSGTVTWVTVLRCQD